MRPSSFRKLPPAESWLRTVSPTRTPWPRRKLAYREILRRRALPASSSAGFANNEDPSAQETEFGADHSNIRCRTSVSRASAVALERLDKYCPWNANSCRQIPSFANQSQSRTYYDLWRPSFRICASGLRRLRLNPTLPYCSRSVSGVGYRGEYRDFQLIDAIRLQALPVEKPSDLAYIDFTKGAMHSGWFSTRSARLTYALWEQIHRRPDAFDGTMAWSAARFNLAKGGEARPAEGLYVSADFFSVLGVPPVLGRVFTAQDDVAGCGAPPAVISYPFWQREFAGDPAVLNHTVSLDGRSVAVIGVTPPSFFRSRSRQSL